MKIEKIFSLPLIRILDFIYENSPVRHKDIAKIVKSRGTLSLSLNSLIGSGLVSREVSAETVPIQSYYHITEKGKIIAEKIREIKNALAMQA